MSNSLHLKETWVASEGSAYVEALGEACCGHLWCWGSTRLLAWCEGDRGGDVAHSGNSEESTTSQSVNCLSPRHACFAVCQGTRGLPIRFGILETKPCEQTVNHGFWFLFGGGTCPTFACCVATRIPATRFRQGRLQGHEAEGVQGHRLSKDRSLLLRFATGSRYPKSGALA